MWDHSDLEYFHSHSTSFFQLVILLVVFDLLKYLDLLLIFELGVSFVFVFEFELATIRKVPSFAGFVSIRNYFYQGFLNLSSPFDSLSYVDLGKSGVSYSGTFVRVSTYSLQSLNASNRIRKSS